MVLVRYPSLADWLLKRFAPPHLREDVLGDLHEEYRRFTVLEQGPIRARARSGPGHGTGDQSLAP